MSDCIMHIVLDADVSFMFMVGWRSARSLCPYIAFLLPLNKPLLLSELSRRIFDSFILFGHHLAELLTIGLIVPINIHVRVTVEYQS